MYNGEGGKRHKIANAIRSDSRIITATYPNTVICKHCVTADKKERKGPNVTKCKMKRKRNPRLTHHTRKKKTPRNINIYLYINMYASKLYRFCSLHRDSNAHEACFRIVFIPLFIRFRSSRSSVNLSSTLSLRVFTLYHYRRSRCSFLLLHPLSVSLSALCFSFSRLCVLCFIIVIKEVWVATVCISLSNVFMCHQFLCVFVCARVLYCVVLYCDVGPFCFVFLFLLHLQLLWFARFDARCITHSFSHSFICSLSLQL